jgi:putative membrane protein
MSMIDATRTAGYNIKMKQAFIKWVMNTIAIMLAVKFVEGIHYSGEWWGILLVGLLFGLVNTFIRPLVRLFTFPLLILTLGIFTFVINAMMLSVTSWLSDKFALGFHVEGFKPAFWGALVISLVSLVLGCLMPPKEE